MCITSKHRCFNVGPPFLTLALNRHPTKACSLVHRSLTHLVCRIPATMLHGANVGFMLAHRLRLWPNMNPTFVQCIVLQGIGLVSLVHNVWHVTAKILSRGFRRASVEMSLIFSEKQHDKKISIVCSQMWPKFKVSHTILNSRCVL